MLVVKQFRSKYKEGVEGYLEEGIIRRELSDNFCYYNPNYDSIEGKGRECGNSTLRSFIMGSWGGGASQALPLQRKRG